MNETAQRTQAAAAHSKNQSRRCGVEGRSSAAEHALAAAQPSFFHSSDSKII